MPDQSTQHHFLGKTNAMNTLDLYVYKMRHALKNDINSNLSLQEKEKINPAIRKATNLLNDNNQQNEIDVFEDCVKELETMFGHILGKNR
ncbi:Heat shock protein 70kD, C-terminal domain superfamily [Sesbania bispinosa]|nr:Heat shock protein 70kD, C-terminal domain superfamily [Sesbania bispinosa]